MLMTLAMAFFSIALTLNLTGVHLNQLKLSDLKPSTVATTVSHQYFTSYAHMRRYYENLRIFYILESRVNEIRDNVRPAADSGSQQPASQSQPQQRNSQPQSTGKPDGAARRGSSSARPAQRQSPVENGAPVLASGQPSPNRRHSQLWALTLDTVFPYPGDHHKPTERSLV